MSTICVVVMATYGRTLCWEKKNTVPKTGWCLLSEKKKKQKKTSVEGAPAVEASYILGTLPMRRGWGLSP